jgi:hypothetical protein
MLKDSRIAAFRYFFIGKGHGPSDLSFSFQVRPEKFIHTVVD